MNLLRFFLAAVTALTLVTIAGHQSTAALTGEKLPQFTVKILDGIRVPSSYFLDGSVLRAKIPVNVLLVPNLPEYLDDTSVTSASGTI